MTSKIQDGEMSDLRMICTRIKIINRINTVLHERILKLDSVAG